MGRGENNLLYGESFEGSRSGISDIAFYTLDKLEVFSERSSFNKEHLEVIDNMTLEELLKLLPTEPHSDKINTDLMKTNSVENLVVLGAVYRKKILELEEQLGENNSIRPGVRSALTKMIFHSAEETLLEGSGKEKPLDIRLKEISQCSPIDIALMGASILTLSEKELNDLKETFRELEANNDRDQKSLENVLVAVHSDIQGNNIRYQSLSKDGMPDTVKWIGFNLAKNSPVNDVCKSIELAEKFDLRDELEQKLLSDKGVVNMLYSLPEWINPPDSRESIKSSIKRYLSFSHKKYAVKEIEDTVVNEIVYKPYKEKQELGHVESLNIANKIWESIGQEVITKENYSNEKNRIKRITKSSLNRFTRSAEKNSFARSIEDNASNKSDFGSCLRSAIWSYVEFPCGSEDSDNAKDNTKGSKSKKIISRATSSFKIPEAQNPAQAFWGEIVESVNELGFRDIY